MKEKGNSIADISSLGAVKSINLDLGPQYKDTKESTFRLPAAGVYLLQAPESFPAAAFGRTANGDLKVQIDPKIIGPTNEGFQLRYISVSAKSYERDGGPVSQVGDYLRATGFRGEINDEQELANAVESTANLTFRAKVEWRASKGRDFEVKGMKNFPKLADGSYQSWVEHPTEKNEEGQPLRLRANLVIDRFYPAAE